MQGKVKKYQGETVLQYESSPQNPLDVAAVNVLEREAPPRFLAFSVIQSSTGVSEVRYDISRATTLALRLRELPDVEALKTLLRQTKETIDTCIKLKLLLKNIAFAYNTVYYDRWSDSVKFAYLPFGGIEPNAQVIQEFFVDLPNWVEPPDASTAQLLLDYSNYFAGNPKFNPIAFSDFLGTIAMPSTDVDWNAVQKSKELRLADSPTTELAASASAVHAQSEAGGRAEGAVGHASHHVEPATEVRAEKKGTIPEQGAHARVDPGTTVLGSLPFDFSNAEEPAPDGTTVLNDLQEPESQQAVSGALEAEAREPEPAPEPEGGSTSAPEPEYAPDSSPAHASEPVPVPEPEPVPVPEPEPVPEPVPEKNTELASASARDSSSQLSSGPIADAEKKPARSEEAASARSAKTFWLKRRSNGEKVQIKGDRFEVGKSKYRDYQVRDTTTVSRSHAIFRIKDGACWIEDDDSRNGTYVDNRRIDAHVEERLDDGMVIRMSDEEFEFTERGGDEPSR